MPSLTRRSFLIGSAALGLGACTAPVETGESHTRIDVAVVGAGLAGLAAAYELHQAGLQVTVLESRDRVGGRAWTLRDSFQGGQYAEAGGEFIDGPHSQIRKYSKTFNLELEAHQSRYDDAESVVYRNRRQTMPQYLGHDDGEVEDDVDRFWEAAANLAEKVPDPANPAAAPDAGSLDARSMADFISDLDLHPDAKWLIEAEIVGEYAAQPEDVSLLFFAQNQALYSDVSDDEIEGWRIGGGNDQLPKAFAAKLGSRVLLDSAVTRIGKVGAEYEVIEQGQPLRANAVIVATPLPPIRDIVFDPGLPSDLADAVRNLGQGPAVKTMTQYPSRRWLKNELSGDAFTSLRMGGTWDATSTQLGDRGILSALAGGQGARKLVVSH